MNKSSVQTGTPEQIISQMQGEAGIDTAIVKDGPVFDNVVPSEEVEQKGGQTAEQMSLPDSQATNQTGTEKNVAKQDSDLEDDQVIKLR